mgnify:CR=1 FL=1
MKKITNLLMLLAVALLTACDNEIETVPSLKVTPYNLEGTWRLDEWNADTLAENTYVYLVLDSKLTFEMYQNTNSMYTELITGTYKVEEDWRVGDVISGTYDYENGAWNHEYIVTDLYKESMVWTAKDDSTDIQKFVRVDEVPAHIVDEARKPLE